MKILKFLLFVYCVSICPSALANSLELKKFDTHFGGLWHVYAPDLFEYKGVRRMMSGGWLVEEHTGPDQIYYSEFRRKKWSAPIPSFKKEGYAVNDPSVIQHPEHKDWLFMYYTALKKDNQSFSDITENNLIGMASSIDGGKTWTDRGIIIGKNNGLNNHGAWAPSALLSPDETEIWIYYHTNSPSLKVFRTRLKLNGIEKIDQTQEVLFYKKNGNRLEKHPLTLGRLNIDVERLNSKSFLMVTNENSLSRVGAYKSDLDGLKFVKLNDYETPLIYGGDKRIYTPAIETLGSSKLNIYFGYGDSENTCSKAWAAQGINDIYCSGSIHGWSFRYK